MVVVFFTYQDFLFITSLYKIEYKTLQIQQNLGFKRRVKAQLFTPTFLPQTPTGGSERPLYPSSENRSLCSRHPQSFLACYGPEEANKIKKLKLVCWLNYKSYNTLVAYFNLMLLNLHNSWLLSLTTLHTTLISYAVNHNPQINVFVVYLLIKELFANNKIHILKFLSMIDKP